MRRLDGYTFLLMMIPCICGMYDAVALGRIGMIVSKELCR